MSIQTIHDIRRRFAAGQLTKPEFIDQMHELHRQLYAYADLLKTSEVSSIEITAGKIVMTVGQPPVRMNVDFRDKRLTPVEALNFGAYEPEETAMMRALVRDGDTVFDVGANIGYYSMRLAKLFSRCRFLAFEPIPTTFAALTENLRLNQLTETIATYNLGFSDKAGRHAFYFYPEGSGNASLANLTEGAGVEKLECELRRLDDFTADRKVGVNVMKVDVEGAELLVFRGGLETLKRDRPVIFTEMLRKWSRKFDYHPNEIIELLTSLGYECFCAKGGKLHRFQRVDDATVETNYFFLDPKKHADRLEGLRH